MNQLVKGVLSVGSWFSPIDWSCVTSHACAFEGDMLSVALHRQLLKISRKTLQILFVRQDGDGLRSEKVVVPEREQAHQNRQIRFKWRSTEMLVHLMKATQHSAEVIRSDGNHGRKPDRCIHRV